MVNVQAACLTLRALGLLCLQAAEWPAQPAQNGAAEASAAAQGDQGRGLQEWAGPQGGAGPAGGATQARPVAVGRDPPPDVCVVDSLAEAARVVQQLTGPLRGRVFACDTEARALLLVTYTFGSVRRCLSMQCCYASVATRPPPALLLRANDDRCHSLG